MESRIVAGNWVLNAWAQIGAVVALAAWTSPVLAGVGEAGIKWIKLKGGYFEMGCADGSAACDDWERPGHKVTLEGFEISKSEITVKQYDLCVKAGGCTQPHWDDGTCLVRSGERWVPGALPKALREADFPVVCVDHQQAQAFAKWAGARLPTEAEWEFAARSRGSRKNVFPWGGDKPDCSRAVFDAQSKPGEKPGCGADGPSSVCSKRKGNSEWGLCDMAGNVSEWVADWFDAKFYSASPDTAPTGPAEGAQRVLRGGDWSLPADYLATTKRHREMPDTSTSTVGFRVVR